MQPTPYYNIRRQAEAEEEAIKKAEAEAKAKAASGISDSSSEPSVTESQAEKPMETLTKPVSVEAITEPVSTESPTTAPAENSSNSEESTAGSIIGEHDKDLEAFKNSAGNTESSTFVPPIISDTVQTFPEKEPETKSEEMNDNQNDSNTQSKENQDYDDMDKQNDVTPGQSAYTTKKQPIETVTVRRESKSYGRGVPVALADYASNLFPGVGIEKAIAAYIYVKEGCPKEVALPDDIKEIIKKTNTKNYHLSNMEMQQNVITKISSLENQMKSMQKEIRKLNFMAAYIQYSHDGFAGSTPHDIKDVHFGVPMEYLDKIKTDFENIDTIVLNRANRRIN